jgi:Xaa-Pro aminopeptidase
MVQEDDAFEGGFHCNITCIAVIGLPPEGDEDVHAIVEKAVQTALKAARPGVLAKYVDFAARKVISDTGYGEYFVHRTGHGMGIDGLSCPTSRRRRAPF